ncbi:hypothetical protein [Actibacterium sp. 188UL27-1]|uniref:hypothetical protein n=1 Tax=Actibacterium sp. 188UL27-1 TaxID=2786961 RepID=UPI00195F1ACC|nr:hypothetical protein [Actibacterium sp. 188UL27-1]MBM7067066.1 hypothetical protein [Actibacterium sp. 188UL27-1]
MRRLAVVLAIGLGVALPAGSVAARDYESWRTLDYGGDNNRAGAMSCTNDYLHMACMHFACERRGQTKLTFSDLGFVRDLQRDPAEPRRTKVRIDLPDGARFQLAAKRVSVKGTAYNVVVAQGLDDPRIVESFAELEDGDTKRPITVSPPDGRRTAFETGYIGFAMGQMPELCAK